MAAVFAKRGSVNFFENGAQAETSLVRKTTKYSKRGFVTDAIIFDDLIPFVKKKKAFLKIDIEGSECFSFMNANKFFDQIDVPYILVEIEHTMKFPYCYEFMLNILNDLNYKPFKLPYDFDTKDQPLNYSAWRSWNQNDVIFKKFYVQN